MLSSPCGRYPDRDGKILWQTRVDGPGAVVVNGTVFVDSGSGMWGGTPGIVLLTYTVGGR